MKSLIAALLLFCWFTIKAQTPGLSFVDSLVALLPSQPEDSNKVTLLGRISYNYSTINPEKGIKYGQDAHKLAEKLAWKRGVAIAYADIAINMAALSNHKEALEYNTKALHLYTGLADSNGVAAVVTNIGHIYHMQGNYTNALENFFRTLRIAENLDDKNVTGKITESIGTVYFEQKDYEKARKYYAKALLIYENTDSKRGQARILGNMGMVYNAEGDSENALKHHFGALKANRELRQKSSEQINLANIGYVYSLMKQYKAALKYQLLALQLSRELKSKNNIAVNLGNIGETYYAMATDSAQAHTKKETTQYLQKAIEYLDAGVALCKELNFLGPLAEFSQYLSDAYFLTGDYKKALTAYKQHIAIKDSVFSQGNKLAMAKMEELHELNLKNKDIVIKDKQLEIARLDATNKNKERILYMVGIGLIIIIAGLIINNYNHRIRRQKTLFREIAQLQSHDIRGPVSRILGLVEIFNYNDASDPVNKEVIGYIAKSAGEMDDIINEVVNKSYLGTRKNKK